MLRGISNRQILAYNSPVDSAFQQRVTGKAIDSVDTTGNFTSCKQARDRFPSRVKDMPFIVDLDSTHTVVQNRRDCPRVENFLFQVRTGDATKRRLVKLVFTTCCRFLISLQCRHDDRLW